MIKKEYQEKMNSEIERRMNSPEWNFKIASRVILKRSKNIKRNIFTISSLGLAAAAAMVIFAVFVNIRPVSINDLDRFVAKQIDGTHKEVFKDTYSDNIITLSSNEYTDPTDKLIENALSMR